MRKVPKKRPSYLRLVYSSKVIPLGVAYIPDNVLQFAKAGVEKPFTVIVVPKAGEVFPMKDLESLQEIFGDDLEIFRSITSAKNIIFTVAMPRTDDFTEILTSLGWPIQQKKVDLRTMDDVSRKELGNSFLH